MRFYTFNKKGKGKEELICGTDNFYISSSLNTLYSTEEEYI